MNRRGFLLGGGALAATGGGLALSFRQAGSQEEYDRAMAALRAPLRQEQGLREAVRFATLAANGHNTQPWRFRLSDETVEILPDYSRRTPAVDPDDHHLYASMGCAAENLVLAAQAQGFPGTMQFDSQGDGKAAYAYSAGDAKPSALCTAITKRQSTRTGYDGRSIPRADLLQLMAAADVEGIEVRIITEKKMIGQVRDLVVAGNSIQMADKAFMSELKAWLRFNPRAALEHGDGLFGPSSGNPVLPTWLGKVMFDIAFTAGAENDKYSRHVMSSSGVAIFTGLLNDPAHWFNAGRAAQRFALQATALGLKLAFINQPVEVESLRPELASFIGMKGYRPDLVLRFGYGPATAMSPRRPVNAVIAA